MSLHEQVGKRVKLLRKEKGWSQDALADRMGFTKSFVSKIENGKKKISLDHVDQLAHILDVSPEDLLIEKHLLAKNHEDAGFLLRHFTQDELLHMVPFARYLIEQQKKRP